MHKFANPLENKTLITLDLGAHTCICLLECMRTRLCTLGLTHFSLVVSSALLLAGVTPTII
jgi:hypothetical protein